MNHLKWCAAAFAAAGAQYLAQTARASLITNGSFESGTYTLGSDGTAGVPVTSTAITGWNVIDDSVAVLTTPNNATVVAEDGTISIDLTGYEDAPPYGGVTQSIATTPGTRYSLSFWIGQQNDVSDLVGPVGVTASAGTASQNFINTSPAAGQQWEQFSLPFTASSSSTLISLTGLSTAGGDYIGLDNVSVSAVPEPASTALLGVPAAMALLRRRRVVNI
jgi:hypothetical protein